jgi:hypothetical protein
MKSSVEGTKVLGLTRANLHVRRFLIGNSSEIVWFFGASTFIGTFVELGLTPSNSKAVPIDFGFQLFISRALYTKGASLWRLRDLSVITYQLPGPAVVPTASAVVRVALETLAIPLLKRIAEDLLVLTLVSKVIVIAFSCVSPVT